MKLHDLYTFNKNFTIKVRCIKKTEMKDSNNINEVGNFYSFIVIDKTKTEIQVTCFNKVAQNIYNTINEEHVYRIKGGCVKKSKQKYKAVVNDSILFSRSSAKSFDLKTLKIAIFLTSCTNSHQ